jgi:hypothetical protein
MLRLALIVMAVVLAVFSPASAAPLFDDFPRTNPSPQSNPFRSLDQGSPLAAITVSAPTSINQIGARVDLTTAGNLKFLIFDLTSHTLLFGTGATSYIDDGLTFKVSPVFSDFLLTPGTVYGIGAIADVTGNWAIGIPPLGTTLNFTQNNITADAHRNGNVNMFSSPTLFADGAVMGIVQLFGAAQVVPEPTTFGFLVAGFAALAAAARRRGRRRS